MPFFTPSKERQFEIDYERYTPIEVMAYWSEDGKVTPIRLKYVNPDESKEEIRIESIKNIKNIRGGFSYCCVATCYGRHRQFNLVFFVNETLWCLEK